MSFEGSYIQIHTLNGFSPTRSSCIDYWLWDGPPPLIPDWYDKGGFSFDLICVTHVSEQDQKKGYTQSTMQNTFSQFGMPKKVQTIAMNGWRSPLGERSHLYWGMVDGFRLVRMQKEWMEEQDQHYYQQGDGEWFVTSCLCAGMELKYAIALRAAIIRHLQLKDLSPNTAFDHASSGPFFRRWDWSRIRQLTFDIVEGRAALPECQLGPWITLHERLRLPLPDGLATLRAERHVRSALINPGKSEKKLAKDFFSAYEVTYSGFSTQTLLGFGFNGLLRDVTGPLPGATTFSDTMLTVTLAPTNKSTAPISLRLVGRRAAGGEEATACWGTILGFKCLRIEEDWLHPELKDLFYLSDGEWFMIQCLAANIPFIAALCLRASLIEILHKISAELLCCSAEDLEYGSGTVQTLWKRNWQSVKLKERTIALIENNTVQINLGRWVMQPEISLPVGLQHYSLITTLDLRENAHRARAFTQPIYGQDDFSREAFRSFSHSSSSDPEVRYAMALAYRYGQGVEPDLNQALSWLEGADRPPVTLHVSVLRDRIEKEQGKEKRIAERAKNRIFAERFAAVMRAQGFEVDVEDNGFLHVHHDTIKTSASSIKKLSTAMFMLEDRYPDKKHELYFSHGNWTQLEYKILNEQDVVEFAKVFSQFSEEVPPVQTQLQQIFERCKIKSAEGVTFAEHLQQALRKLAAAGDTDALRYLIDEYKTQFDLNARDSGNTHKRTALHWAVAHALKYPEEKEKYSSCIKLLIENGAKSNIPDIQGTTALDYAGEDAELLKRLQHHPQQVILPAPIPESPISLAPEKMPSKKKKRIRKKRKGGATNVSGTQISPSISPAPQGMSESSDSDTPILAPITKKTPSQISSVANVSQVIVSAPTAPKPRVIPKKAVTPSELLSAQILHWSIDSLGTSPTGHALAALPIRSEDLTLYYRQFIPLILEETRAKLSEYIARIREYDRQGGTLGDTDGLSDDEEINSDTFIRFDLTLQQQGSPARDGGIVTLTFAGAIPKIIPHGRTLNVLLLSLENGQNCIELLGIAAEKQSALQIEINLTHALYAECAGSFQKGKTWTARFLGSIALEQRMHEACLQASEGPCMAGIARGEMSPLYTSKQAVYPNLSKEQDNFVQGFLALETGAIAILQGGPGTGKSTTLGTIITDLSQRGEQIMVCTHSNRGIRILAHKVSHALPKTPMLLITVQSQIPAALQHLALYTWYGWIKVELQNAQAHAHHYAGLKANTPIKYEGTALLSYLRTTLQTVYDALALFELRSSDLSDERFAKIFNLLEATHLQESDKIKLQKEIDNLTNAWCRKKQDSVEHHLLQHCKLVFVTLSGAGQKSLENLWQPNTLIVDEAERAVEAETLIAMQHRPDKVLLAGDPKQLAPRSNIKTLSPVYANWLEGKTYGYRRSMLERLGKQCSQPVTTLPVQYRMHPDISRWPANYYYKDVSLHTPPLLLARSPLSKVGLLTRPYALYTLGGKSKTDRNTRSSSNPLEADYVVKIVDQILMQAPTAQIGVVSPYVAQKMLIIKKLGDRMVKGVIEVDTVDNFQGEEKDVIILSLTTTKSSPFLEEPGRLIVALTTAKHNLIILGCFDSLRLHDLGVLIKDADQRGVRYDKSALDTGLRQASSVSHQNVIHLYESYYKRAEQPHISGEERFRLCKIAAEGDYAPAQCMLAKYYWPGVRLLSTISENLALSVAWLERATAQGHSEAAFFLAEAYAKGDVLLQDDRKSLALYEKAAALGHATAAYLSGQRYQMDVGTNQNTVKAVQYYRQAATANHQEAAYALAKMLPVEAGVWYEKAATLGHPAARKYCAKTCFDAKDYVNAIRYFQDLDNLAAEESYQFSFSLQQIKSSQQTKIFTLYQAAAQANLKEAHYQLGQLYATGKGCAPSLEKAHLHYKNAAEQGHILAMYYLADLLDTGSSTLHNPQEAFSWFAKAASRCPEAEYRRCTLLLTGKGVQANAFAAFAGLKRIADAHAHVHAQYQLYLLLRDGRACTVNITEALRYATLAAVQGHVEAAYEIGQHYATQNNVALATRYLKMATDKKHVNACYAYALVLRSQGNRQFVDYLQQASAGKHKDAGNLLLKHYLSQQNWGEAYRLCETLCQQSPINPLAHYALARLLQSGATGRGVSQQNALTYYVQALNAGETRAAFYLGCIKERESRFQEAREYYARAPQREAKFYLACLLAEGHGGVKDSEAAISYFNAFLQTPAEMEPTFMSLQGLTNQALLGVAKEEDAHYRLGLLYKSENRHVEARQSFERVTTHTHRHYGEAMYELGSLHEAGAGTPRDETRARAYYQQASRLGHSGATYKLSTLYTMQRFFGSEPSRNTSSATRASTPKQQDETNCLVM